MTCLPRPIRAGRRGRFFDGNNQKAARIAVLNYIADELAARIPGDYPELAPDIAELAEAAFGNQAGEG